MLRILLCVLLASLGAQAGPDQCGPCDLSACRTPDSCLAGLVRDACGCCMVCGQREGHRCFHRSVAGSREHGPCGEDLECRPRADLAPGDPAEALCVCSRPGPMCGSDGVTYDSVCQLTEARYKRRDGLEAASVGPCMAAPRVLTPPEHTRNTTGGRAAMSCEVTGYPVPSVEWRVDKGNGLQVPLPTDDPRVSVQTRGGPNSYELSSWLQLLSLVAEDTATYWCVATNDLGEASAAAKLNVIR
ncbi:unnamed protein product [Ixodes hexagonus]